jgi:hypothetical protein
LYYVIKRDKEFVKKYLSTFKKLYHGDRLKVFWHMIRVLFLLSGIFFDFFIDKSEEIE